MHQHPANANGVGSRHHAQTGITHQRTSDTLPMQGLVDGQTAKHHYRNRIGHVAT